MAPENEIARHIVDCAFCVHQRLGPGLLESVYERIMAYELEKRGLRVARQTPIDIRYDDLWFKDAFRLDLLVQDLVIVELKSVEQLAAVHKKQTLTYLKLGQKRLGLLINFGEKLIKDGIVRLVNGLPEG